MTQTIHIVAVGARTPVGLTAESSAAAIRAGISRVREHPFMVDGAGKRLTCAYDPVVEPQILGTDRLAALSRGPLQEVIAKVTRNRAFGEALPVLLSLPEGRPGFGPSDGRRVQEALEATTLPGKPNVRVDLVGEGHAGSLRGLQLGVQRLVGGKDDVCIVAGVDGYLDADTLDWLESRWSLGGVRRSGDFTVGEGASAIALATESARRALGLPSLARIRTVACATETRDGDSDEGVLGEALAKVLAWAGKSLRRDERIEQVYCDINGERSRTDDWGFALLRTSTVFRDGTMYTMTASQCGDLGAATVGLNAALAVQAWERRYAHGPLSLIWGASWNGLRGAAILDYEAA